MNVEELLLRRRQLMGSEEEPDPYLSQPLTFVFHSGGTIYLDGNDSSLQMDWIKMKLNDGQWETFSAVRLANILTGVEYWDLTVSAGDKLYVIGQGPWTLANDRDSLKFDITDLGQRSFSLEGNLLSLVGGDNFTSCTAIPDGGLCGGIYVGDATTATRIYDISNLRIPAESVGDYGLAYFFSQKGGYMVGDIKKLLPAKTLGVYSYREMFYSCNYLETAPDLPATTMKTGCYHTMFRGCTRITKAPEIKAQTLAGSCFRNMFYGCTGLTTAPNLNVTTLQTYCYYAMFRGCTGLTTAPVLPATTLVNYCYQQMFYGCTHLNYIKCLATNISATSCTTGWVTNVASSGTFVKNTNMSGWGTGANGIPSNWTVDNATS